MEVKALDRRTLVYIFDKVANMQIERYKVTGLKDEAYGQVMTLLNKEMEKEKEHYWKQNR